LQVWPAGTSWVLGVEPTVVGHELRARVVRVGRTGRFARSLGLPERFVRTYSAPIPAPEPLTVLDATLADAELVVRYAHPGIRRPIELDRVRDLVRSDTSSVDLADLAG
jgi:hypothetical protein